MKPETIATKRYLTHPNYAMKLIIKFPTPGVSLDDYPGLWYEALYNAAIAHPERASKERLHLVMAYRMLCDDLRSRNRKMRSNPLDWGEDGKYEKEYKQLIIELQNNTDDILYEDY